MNRILIESIPAGKFEEISIEMDGWQLRFENLIREGKKIHFDTFDMPTISEKFLKGLEKHGYVDLILESDDSQHFLVTNGRFTSSITNTNQKLYEN